MAALERTLRRQLESTVRQARREAEAAARVALDLLAVREPKSPDWLDTDNRRLRADLRARAKSLGDGVRDRGWEPLIEEIAYAQWHRRLFARFLAANHLLIHPDAGVAVPWEDLDELAAAEGAANGWELAIRYAGAMLPGIFATGDPAMQVTLAPEARIGLERLVSDLPPAVFAADDALGWVYQYWQADRKAEVNQSGRKIGAAELSPVTQLFTEDYMVRFLLENTLGAWWAARHPNSPLVREYEYLRFRDDGSPAAGGFDGWPQTAAGVTVMDPCCGSGHFLVAAFGMLRRMRMEEEGFDAAAAGDAVLRDNLHGLELDPRCVQIATFAVAFEAWKSGGYRELPSPHIACSGIAVQGQWEDWKRFARGDTRLEASLQDLHTLFREAPVLGSLIDPQRVNARLATGQTHLLAHEWDKVEKAVHAALARETAADPSLAVFGHDAEGAARAASLLGRRYTLVATNVPYLTRGKQEKGLAEFLAKNFVTSKADLATAFMVRCLAFADQGGSIAVVTPQNWLSLGSYARMRSDLLVTSTMQAIVPLGPAAFSEMNWWAATTLLSIIGGMAPGPHSEFMGIDATTPFLEPSVAFGQKATLLRTADLAIVSQAVQHRNPDERITLEVYGPSLLLSHFADSYWGLGSGDYPRFGRCFWEVSPLHDDWVYQQSTVDEPIQYGGREHILFWEHGKGALVNLPGAFVRATHIWGKQGVTISQMRNLPATLYGGDAFDTNCSPIIPKDPAHLPAIWAFCSSPEFNQAVRRIDTKLNVTNATLVKVPFDLERWQQVAAAQYPDGLPEPHSDDPTQWLFKGTIAGAEHPLQVAVARLLGYRWPDQQPDHLDRFADADGSVPLPPLRGERSAAERLRDLLATAYGSDWSPALQQRLLEEEGFAGQDLAAWLASPKGFFSQHVSLFHNRPFIWHIWDGHREGFSALVNYHKLDASTLDRLIYTYLGDWIGAQRQLAQAGEAAAGGRLEKALDLQRRLLLIRAGEHPYDVYVRWKPLHAQPTGWEPDLDDGVRLNIRPFITAGVLRSKVTVNWNKDRGANPAGSDAQVWAAEAQRVATNRAGLPSTDGTERHNDLHLDLATKRAARTGMGGAGS